MSVWPILPWVAVGLPVAGAAWIGAVAPGRRAAGIAAVGTTAVVLAACVALALADAQGLATALSPADLVPPVALALRVDAPGALFALTVSLLYVPATLHAASWLADDPRWRVFLTVLLACQGPMLLVAFADNLLTLLVGYELFSLASFVAIVHRRTTDAFGAGVKYLAYVIPGGALALAGTVIVFFAAGSLTFTAGGMEAWSGSEAMHRTAWACLVFGFGVKAALFPLHGWVPDAHPAAPAPFSAILSGVMVATGVFAIVRVLYQVFGPGHLQALGVMPWMTVPAAIGVVAAGALAVGEDDLKRRLAYSTISQVGYATVAVSLLEPGALAGALVHLANHAFIKGGLFFAVGAIAIHAGAHRVSELRGLARRMPMTAAMVTLLTLALIGVPPLSGFVGKWLLVSGAAEARAWVVFAVLLVGSLLAAMYLWPIVYAIWRPPAGEAPTARVNEPRDGMRLATVIAGVLVVLFGIAASTTGFPLALARRAAELLAGGG